MRYKPPVEQVTRNRAPHTVLPCGLAARIISRLFLRGLFGLDAAPLGRNRVVVINEGHRSRTVPDVAPDVALSRFAPLR